jgi:hypothetical protein
VWLGMLEGFGLLFGRGPDGLLKLSVRKLKFGLQMGYCQRITLSIASESLLKLVQE